MNEIDLNTIPDSPFDLIMGEDGRWSARDLQGLMGYAKWQNLKPALERAMATARNQGHDVDSEFSQVTQLMGSGNLGEQKKIDYRLSRMAAYLLAMNGDPNKPEIAAAQAYFVNQTRKAEIQESAPALPQSFAEALRLAADQQEEIERQARELEVAQPKVEKWDHFLNSDTEMDMLALAKTLPFRIGRNRLFEFLREEGVMFRNDGSNIPYQRHVDLGRFIVRQIHLDKLDEYVSKTLVTAKGAEYIYTLLKDRGWPETQG